MDTRNLASQTVGVRLTVTIFRLLHRKSTTLTSSFGMTKTAVSLIYANHPDTKHTLIFNRIKRTLNLMVCYIFNYK